MNDPTEASDSSSSSASAIVSRRDFVDALLGAVQSALTQRARRMVWVDPDFAEWPLDDPLLLEVLTQWLRLPQRRLVLLAESFDDVSRRCSRFLTWYRLWAHAVNAFSPEPGDPRSELPSLVLVEDTSLVHLVDREHWRGRITLEPAALRLCRDRVDALLQRSDPAFPASTLGL